MAIAAPALEMGQKIAAERRNRRHVRIWLYFICLLIAAIVLVGGATRLTDSGLSITEWQPVHGVVPPLSQAQWLDEFEKYKAIPEYSQINAGMDLAAFKRIYWWEWAHRLLGRLIGVAFALPLAWFWLAGALEPRMKPRLLVLLVLGGVQGGIGWWMVTSGLADRTDVSQYRLAIHLTVACIILAGTLWVARGLAPHAAAPAGGTLRAVAALGTVLVLVQIFLGALVAGLDAGLAYNEWPTMDGAWIPGDLFIQQPPWRNLFENPKTVQFIHRGFAYFLLAYLAFQWLLTLRRGPEPQHTRRAALLVALALVQAAIGVTVLLLQVPIGWALAHQAVAVAVLAFSVAHWRALRGPYLPVTAVELRH